MILVRPSRDSDLEEIHTLYEAQGLPYAEPKWTEMMMSAVIKRAGQVQMACFLRRTAEAYLLLNPNAEVSKKDRLGQLLLLHKELINPAKQRGLTDVHLWIPPGMERFGKLLENPKFGWTKTTWPGYVKEF